jgi:hypothetical protein
MKRKDGMVIALLGIIAALLFVLTFQVQSAPDAQGQTAAASSGKVMMATGPLGGSGCSCWIYDLETKRVVVYTLTGRSLAFAGARLCTYDLMCDQYPTRGVKPTPSDIRDLLKKGKK